MPDSTETRSLLLQINATTELLRSQLSEAEKATADFQHATEQHLTKVDERFELLGKGVEKLEKPLERLKSLGEGAIGYLLGESLVETGKKALEFAGNIQFVSEQVGTSTDFLQKYRYAASQFGVASGEADEGLGKFTRSIGEAADGNKSLVTLFDRLGVKVLDATGKVRSTEAVYFDTANAIAKLDNPAQKAADVMQLMGKQSIGLVPLLSAGASGFNDLATAAEQLGVVLSPDLIEHSEQVNHKLSALKQIVDAEMASAIAQNAVSIEQLAGSLVRAAGAVATFLGGHPERASAILGSLVGLQVGSRFGPLGGAIGGTVGLVGGTVVGSVIKNQQDDADPGLATRKRLFDEARAQYKRDQALRQGSAGAFPGNAGYARDRDEFVYQGRRLQDAIAHPHVAEERALGSPNPGISNPDVSHHPKGKPADQLAREAEAARQRALADDRAFQGQLRTANEALAKAKLALADTAQGQLAVDIQTLRDAEATREQQVDDQISAGKITAARGSQLKALYRETEADDEILAQRKAQAQTIGEQAAREALQVQGQIDLLSLDDRLATTRQERLRIELQLLALQERLAKAAQQAIIDDPTKSQVDKDLARGRITQIDAQSGRNQQLIERQNQSPLDAYRDQLRSATGDTNDALQGVAVQGLQGLEDKITGTIGKVLGLKGAFGELAASVIDDLLKIEVERAILGVIGGGNPVTSVLGLFGGGRAGGGGVEAGKVYEVGENGRELFAPGVSGSIIPNGALRSPSVGSLTPGRGGGGSLVFDMRGALVTEDLLQQMNAISARHASVSIVAGSRMAQQDLAERQMQAIPS